MDMSKYKPLFLSETGEHLDALEADLVALENAPEESQRIHEIFRHLHSVKSMAASMGYQPLSTLAHRLEDLVAPHREHGLQIEPDEVDLLLRGLDELRGRLRMAAEDKPIEAAPEAFLEELTGAAQRAGGRVEAAPEPPGGQAPEPAEAAAPVQTEPGTETDGPAYDVKLEVAANCSLPAVRAFVAYRRLAALGRVATSDPSADQLRAGHLPERTLSLRLHTRRQAGDVRRVAEGLPELAQVTVVPVVAEIQTDPPAPGASQPPRPQAAPATSTVRVRTELLDFFVDSVGELITLRSYFDDLAERLDAPALRDGVRRMNTTVRRLQDRLMEVRMVPVSMLTARLPRVCRDVARSRGKRVGFEVQGETVELDRALIEALDTPLLHLLRNAVEHGLESPDERIAAGKPPEGRIVLGIQRQQDRVLIQLSDDGRGIDPARVLEKARAAGHVDPEDDLSDEQALDLIFLAGLSTRDGVSDLSGRGVGLDVVRDSLERLGGRVSVSSAQGEGTTFNLDMPLTLAILQILLIQAGDHLMALPASRVLRAVAIRADQIHPTDGGQAVSLGGRRYPFAPLGRLLGLGDQTDASEVLLVGGREEPELALGVDRVTGHRETVLKGVGRLLREVGPFNASTVLGDGRPVLILDVDALIARAASAPSEA